jgi:hypothetical protein
VIPLNQLIPECLLALGAAFLLGNLAAYVRLRPAWREAKDGRGGQGEAPRAEGAKRSRPDGAAKAQGTTEAARPRATRTRPGRAGRSPSGASATDDGPGNLSKRSSTGGGPGKSASKPRERRPAGAKAAAVPRSNASRRVNARVREPTASKSLPSRTRVLVNVIIGFLVTVAALAALIRG